MKGEMRQAEREKKVTKESEDNSDQVSSLTEEVARLERELREAREVQVQGGESASTNSNVSAEEKVSFCRERSDELKTHRFRSLIGCASSSRLDVDATIIAAHFQVANVHLHATRNARCRALLRTRPSPSSLRFQSRMN